MAHNEQSAGSGCALGLDWNATNTDGGTYKLAPTLWRYDSSSTDNYGSSWSEYLYYEPSGSTGHWTGGWGSGSGWRKYDSFSTRTYTKNHSSYTVKITINTDSEFGTWNGGWVTLGSKSFSWSTTVPARTSYTVSFNANGGSGAPSNQTKWYGESLTLSSTTPTRTGYTFNGWNTKSDGSGTNYAKGASYTGNAALTLYAKWTINTWTVSYNGNGSTGGSTASQTKTYNTALTLRSNGFTKTNHVFKNWNTAANGSGTSYAAGASYTGNAALTLYAQWYAPYTISYNANGGSGAPASQTKIYNSTLTLSSSTPTRANYNFIGWNTNEAGTGTSYSPGGSYTANAAATLYAVWEIAHANPTITNLLVRRCLSDGTPDNQGTNVLVEADWSVDTSTEGFEDTVGYQCRITLDSKVDTISLSGTSGHISRVHQSNGANTDILLTSKYPVTLAVEDSHNFVASRSSTISISFFTVHYKAGGTGIGVGKATNRDALDVGMEAWFDQDVHVGADANFVSTNPAFDLSLANNGLESGIKYPAWYAMDNAGRIMSRVEGVVNSNGSNGVQMYARNYDANGDSVGQKGIAVHVAKDGTSTWSVSDPANFRTAINSVNKSGDTMTGDLTLSDRKAYRSTYNQNVRRNATAPSSAVYGSGQYVNDSNGDNIFYSEMAWTTDRKLYRSFIVRRCDSAGANAVTNGFYIGINNDATKYVTVTDPAAWRSALGFGTDLGWTNLATATNFYIKYMKRGRLVFVVADSRGGKTASTSGYTTLGTLPSGYRPNIEFWAASSGIGSSTNFTIHCTTGGVVGLNASSGGGDYWSFMIGFPVA